MRTHWVPGPSALAHRPAGSASVARAARQPAPRSEDATVGRSREINWSGLAVAATEMPSGTQRTTVTPVQSAIVRRPIRMPQR
jgi:hypothetical protein